MTKQTDRLEVRKTYKLFMGGKFPRSESGRSLPVLTPGGDHIANASWASRKDVREAVRSARGAVDEWAKATAYNRGQVLYRIAEMVEGRRDQFVHELVELGWTKAKATAEVDNAIDTWVFYAGFSDKFQQIVGCANPVAAPYFNFSIPEAMGVIAVIAPENAPLSGLAHTIAPAIVSGNSVVAVADDAAPTVAITFAECVATSDVPGGVVNILTGKVAELAPVLAGHMDVNAIDLAGAPEGSLVDLETKATDNLKRVVRPRSFGQVPGDLQSIERLVELKTVWHPIGV